MREKITYEIRIRDVLDAKWGAYFAPFKIMPGQEQTLLTGVVCDQAELFGILLKIRDLGLELVAVNQSIPVEEDLIKI